jgi:hypothetical protein
MRGKSLRAAVSPGVKTKMEELKSRLYKNAQTQEGDEPAEQPLALLNQFHEESTKFEKLVIKINKTNSCFSKST